ncbi:hypothetical protein DFH08DRAFT_902025, partial [Mycena albidolilacea]
MSMLSVDGESYPSGQYKPRYAQALAGVSRGPPVPSRVESRQRTSTSVMPAKPSVTPARPSEEVVAEAKSIPDSYSAEIRALVDKIVGSKTLEVESSEFTVEPKIWPVLALALPEDLGARFHYSSTTSILIVTWPCAVHESFVWISDVFLEAKKKDSTLISATNTAIPFEGEYQGDTSIPDFALGRKTSDGEKYHVIIEAAYSQTAKKLENVAAKHLTRPDVACVIGLDFTSPQFHYPPTSPTPVQPLTQSAFIHATSRSPDLLGAVKIGNTTWAPAIKHIVVTIWMQRDSPAENFERKTWDITPIANQIDHPNLLARHAQIDKLIRGISRAVIAQPTFGLAYPDKNSFRINWTGLYNDLPRRLLVDSWSR